MKERKTMKRKSVHRICKRCMRSWNVSSIDPPGKADYICPECEAKEKEEEHAA